LRVCIIFSIQPHRFIMGCKWRRYKVDFATMQQAEGEP